MRTLNSNPYYKKCLSNKEYFISGPENLKGKWERLSSGKKIFLDTGCGGGSYTVEVARRNRDSFFIGVDFSIKFLYSAIKKAKAYKLNNIVFVCYNATEIQNIFSQNEVEGVFFLFSDPYKKKKQKKHQVFSSNFVSQISKILKNNKYLVVKTDDKNYFEKMLQEFENDKNFKIIKMISDFARSEFFLSDIESHYEEKFRSKNIHWLVAVNLKSKRTIS